MANGVIPGGLRQRAVQLALQQQRPTDMSAMMAPGSIAGQVAAGTAMSPLSLRTMALRGATRPRTQAEVLKAYGLGAPSKLPQADVAAPTSAGIADTVASYLPETGTPEMAGLGAAGRTMMQLGGWQDRPYTLGQILGAGAEKGLEAMKARQDAMTAAAEKKAAAERQAMLDAITIGEFNIKRRKAARDEAAAGQPTKPYEIYDIKTGRKKFVRDVRTESGGWTTEDVGGVAAEKPAKEGKPSGFVGVYTKEGEFIGNVREDSAEADAYAKKGYKIIESTTISGTKEDVGLGAKAKGAIETDIMDIQESISDLNDISTSWDPRFQTFATRGEAFLKAALEKAGVDLSPDEAKLVGDVAVYKQNAWDAVNAYIKYLTGAQMSEAEARRIMKSFPDPRLGLFEGDSPTEYKRKLDGVLRKARLSLARNAYALSKGLKPKIVTDADPDKNEDDVIFVDEKNRAIGIEQMPHIMRREESRLRKQFANLKKEDLENRVESEMRRIFAIGA